MDTRQGASVYDVMMQQEMVQAMVHDLRNPLTVIKGNLQLLLSGVVGPMSPDQMRLLQRSVAPVEEMILLINHLLQPTRTLFVETPSRI